MCYSFFKDTINYEKVIYYLIFCRYFNEGLTSPLYKNVREKLQCVYSISTQIKKINKNDFMYFTILFTSNEKIEDVKNEVLNCYKNAEIDEERFNNIVSSIKLDFEKTALLDQMKFEENSLDKKIKEILKKSEITLGYFIHYLNEFKNSDFNIIDDKSFKELCMKEITNE
jgi:predicted Zn-dependent peptidase